jgi:hypothetical protein
MLWASSTYKIVKMKEREGERRKGEGKEKGPRMAGIEAAQACMLARHQPAPLNVQRFYSDILSSAI